MIQFVIAVLALILLYCIVLWLIGIVENTDEYKVMSLRTFYRLLKNNKVFNVDISSGIGYYNQDGYRDWVMPLWTWYPIFAVFLIGGAVHKDVI